MIDTFTIKYPIKYTSVVTLMNGVNPRYFDNLELLDVPEELPTGIGSQKCWSNRELLQEHPGILSIIFYASEISKQVERIMMKIVINPRQLVTRQRNNIRLYYASESNNKILEEAYARAIYTIFPNLTAADQPCYLTSIPTPAPNDLYYRDIEDIPFLIRGIPSRVDYTMNMRSDNPQQLLTLMKGSFHASQKHLKVFDDNQNCMGWNNSKRLTVYDKEEKMCNARYRGLPWIDEVIQASANIVRVELAMTRINQTELNRYCDRYGIGIRRGILAMLNETMSEDLLRRHYAQSIGLQDWYNDYYFKQRLNASNMRGDVKAHCLDVAAFVSQCRSVDVAYNRVGTNYRLANSDKILMFSCDQLTRYINRIRELGLQPLRIPKRIRTNHVVNPFNSTVIEAEDYEYINPSPLWVFDKYLYQRYLDIRNRLHANYQQL